MDKTKLEKMEELDARIEKINYDLSSLETRKKEMEESKFAKQQNIEKLEDEKKAILSKTDKMNRLQKIIYIAFASKNDLKQIDLINVKITEYRNEKDNIQNKIDIQNKLYADTIKEKDDYIEQRKDLYMENTKVQQKQEEQDKSKTSPIKDLAQIYEITMQYKDNKVMNNLRNIVENQINQYLGANVEIKENKKVAEEQDEME